MIRRYIPVDQRNKNRVWPCRSAAGNTIMVRCDQITFTPDDLSEWVRSGLLVDLGAVDEFGRSPAELDKIAKQEKAEEKPPLPAYIKKDNASVFADALTNAFAKPPVQVPEVVPAPAPVVAPEVVSAPVVEPVETPDVVEEPVPAVTELTDAEMQEMTRAELWEVIVGRSLQGGRAYRSVTKIEMIQIILGE